MYTQIFLAITTLVSISSAASPQTPLAPLSCTISLPTSYQQIDQASPSEAFSQGDRFNVSQSSSGNQDVDTLLRFSNVPSGAYGCEVAMSFTFGYDIDSSGSTQLSVYSLPADIGAEDTYATYFPNGGIGTPEGAYLWTTTEITGNKAVLNSKTCNSTMSFLFQIASSTSAGSVAFLDAGDNLSGIGGFYMTYNC